MKQQLKRLLCIASALALTVGCLPDMQTMFPDSVLTASAEDGGSCGENVFWAMENGVLTSRTPFFLFGDGGTEVYKKRIL